MEPRGAAFAFVGVLLLLNSAVRWSTCHLSWTGWTDLGTGSQKFLLQVKPVRRCRRLSHDWFDKDRVLVDSSWLLADQNNFLYLESSLLMAYKSTGTRIWPSGIHLRSQSQQDWRQITSKLDFTAFFIDCLRHEWQSNSFFDFFVTFWRGPELGNFKCRQLWTFGAFRSFFRMSDKSVAREKPTCWQIFL